MVKYNSAKFKKSSGILKSFGLIALVAFTFYFIYNYLTTGSFDLRPSASGALEGDGGVASCGALLTQLDCNKYSERGCFFPFIKAEAISIPVIEKVIPFPPKPHTKYEFLNFLCSPMYGRPSLVSPNVPAQVKSV